MTDITDLPPGASQSDTVWRKGFFDGRESAILSSNDPVYVAGWCHGYNDGGDMSREVIIEAVAVHKPITDYEDLKRRSFLGDQISDVRYPDKTAILDDGLHIAGVYESGDWAPDLWIEILPDKRLRLRYREVSDAPIKAEWSDPILCDTYPELNGFVYEL